MFGHQDDQNNSGDLATPVVNDVPAFPSSDNPAASPVVGAPSDSTPADAFAPSEAPAEVSMPVATPVSSTVSNSDDLVSIKQSALQQLSPLVDQLDQTPEEKFRTTMMMIQAADDQSLIKSAYEAAQQISDEKAKAQALLDVVNEINYFTQHQA